MTAVEPGLDVRGLVVRYGATAAVDDVTFEVASGEVLALVGPSGCGKSTLLRAIAGLVEPAAGSIGWAGRSLAGVPTHERGIGLMFQSHALFGHRNVAGNIAFGLRMQGVDRAEQRRRVDELLDRVGLAGFGERDVQSLSGGEAQRVALARALAPEPALLLLDEPLASLDRALRAELNEQLGTLLHDLGQTAVYVTHDQHEAFAIADRVGVMQAGRLRRVGTPAEVWADPRSVFVASFVGHETIIEHDGRTVAVRSDAVMLDPTGDRAGQVVRCSFEGDRWRLSIGSGAVEFGAWSSEPVAVGEELRFRLDPSRLAVLDAAG